MNRKLLGIALEGTKIPVSIWLLVLLAACVPLCGCASMAVLAPAALAPLNQASSQVQSDTSVKLTENNFVMVRTNAIGRSKGFSLLGLITIVPATLTKAMVRLYAQAGLQEGEANTPANLLVERTSTYYILFSIPKITAMADVVRFKPGPEPGDDGKPKPDPVKSP